MKTMDIERVLAFNGLDVLVARGVASGDVCTH